MTFNRYFIDISILNLNFLCYRNRYHKKVSDEIGKSHQNFFSDINSDNGVLSYLKTIFAKLRFF